MKKIITYVYSIINSLLFINALFGTGKAPWVLFLVVLITTSIPMLIYKIATNKKKLTNDQKIDQNTPSIYNKKELITKCEKEFIIKLNNIFRKRYIIQPQIPLRMIISKNGEENGVHAGELNRYIDFGILNKNYELLALIELNDKTHELEKRQERDLKVQNICRQAKIPLITFWTYEKLTNEEIKHRIEKEINNAR